MTNGDAATPEPPATSTSEMTASGTRRIIIRPYPKVVFFYLTWVICLVCGILMALVGGDMDTGLARFAGLLFFYIFVFNNLTIMPNF